jgi:aspartyl aminopeptidase
MAQIVSAHGTVINEEWIDDCLGISGRGLAEAQTVHHLRNFKLPNLRRAIFK